VNWKKTSENWEKFTELNNLIVEKSDRNYFYGKQEISKAKEYFNNFEIFYEYRFNKSATYGSAFRIGHKMTIIAPIELNQNLEMKVKRNSLWNRLTKRNQNISISPHGTETKDLLPLPEIEKLMIYHPDLEISIKDFNRHQNPNVQFGQKVILMESKYHPTELNQLELTRTIMTKFLAELKDRNLIKASTQHQL
jgi:hypothetical protein